MIDDLKAGAAGSRQLELLGPKMVRHDFAPGFFVKHFIKDMRLADAEAKEDGLQLNVLQTVLDNLNSWQKKGMRMMHTVPDHTVSEITQINFPKSQKDDTVNA